MLLLFQMPYFNGLSSVLECDVGVNDMCLLEELDEENFIDNLKQRFLTNQIYVSMPDSIGSIGSVGSVGSVGNMLTVKKLP